MFMQWCVPFPEEAVLIVRPSLIAICAGQHPAAKLLSVLLYRASLSEPSQPDEQRAPVSEAPLRQKKTPRIYRTQAQLVADMCEELSEKTIHDVALPTLQLLGYVMVDTSSVVYCYTLCLENIQTALEAYRQGTSQLKKVLASQAQFTVFQIELSLENLLMNKKDFRCALEKVRFANRNFSEVKRGPKPRCEAASGETLDIPKNQREIQEKRGEKAVAITLPQYRPSGESHRASGRAKAERTEPSTNRHVGDATGDQTPATREGSTAASRQADASPGTRRTEVVPHLTPRGQQVLEWYEAIRQVKVRPTAENIRASNGLGEMEEVTRENLEAVITLLDRDPWLQTRNLVIDLQELECPKSKFRFERTLLAVKRQQRERSQVASPGVGVSSPTPMSLPDYTHVRPDDLYIRA